MEIIINGKTNKDYVAVNTLKIKLKSGSVLTLDRHKTEYFLGNEGPNGERDLRMTWISCYLWAIDGEYLFSEEALITEQTSRLFEGAQFVELELECDADEDYYLHVEELVVDDTVVMAPFDEERN